ncbi:Doa4p [Paramicrosporidium saccamoebae]|uniref:Doa4p n=1 Tax=Paramicrosporidium saccamoebae TaxID=1246581 RepID=A0A2H9TGK3_9FUNG|nr:Doa4p [Paramicrosporidium saccamoebae]
MVPALLLALELELDAELWSSAAGFRLPIPAAATSEKEGDGVRSSCTSFGSTVLPDAMDMIFASLSSLDARILSFRRSLASPLSGSVMPVDESEQVRGGCLIEKEKGCQLCGKSSKTNYICLNPDCLFVGCGRDDKRHALEHYQLRHKPDDSRYHGFTLNTLAYQCWCYECDDVISPPVFRNMEPDDAATTVSSLNSTSNRRKSSRASVVQLPNGIALQALLNCPSIMGFFQKCCGFVYRHGNRRISESMCKLVDMMFSANMYQCGNYLMVRQVVSPSRLVREVKLINPMFHGYTQQDTMDFVRCIFERIHDEIKARIPCHEHSSDADGANSRRKSERLARQEENRKNGKSKDHPQYRSIISDTFGGLLRSEINCLTCSNISVKDDPFYDVSVQICATPEGSKPTKTSFGYIGNLFSSLGESIGLNGKPVKLETCLAAFCAPETLEGKDRYKCEKCNSLVDSKKSLKFKELPQVLCLQLKRFRHESYFSSKIGTHVLFPIDNMDMSPYLHPAASEESKRETRYYLSSVISHRGTFSGGHYVAYCRSLAAGQWLEFDDSTVTVVSEEEVAKVQAYTLFYSLVDWNARREREEWVSIISEAKPEETDGVYISREWYNRWCTMAEPGPLDNSELVCPHGYLSCEALVDPVELVQFLPIDAYNALSSRHGEVSEIAPLKSPVVCAQCIEEEKALDARRKQEEKDIQSLDTSAIKPGEFWYLISSEWLVAWGQFKSTCAPPPGPISNDRLMRGTEPRPNLLRGTHYRGVNRNVWHYFHGVYGGGPVLVRKSINIYGPEPERQEVDSSDEVYVDVVGQ